MVEIYAYAKGWNHGEDVKAQRSAIRAYGKQHGFKVSHIVVEDEQAFGPVYDRDGGFLFKKANSGDVIIAARFGDLFCSPADALHVIADLESRGVALHVVGIGDMASVSKLFVTMATAFAEGDGKARSARKRREHADAKARGRYTGGAVPFGFRRGDDGKLVPHDGEQDAIGEMIAMRVADWGTPLRAIAAAMVAKGHRISHEGVAGVLRAHMDEYSRTRERWPGGPGDGHEAELIALAQDAVRRSLKQRAKLAGSLAA